MTGFSRDARNIILRRASLAPDEFVNPVCEVMARCQGRAVAGWGDLHHRRARGMGSTKRPESNLPANGLATCRDCHHFIENARELALKNGWLVRQNQTPAEVPILYRQKWARLDDEGNVTYTNGQA